MNAKSLMLLTGSGGDAQGWGSMTTTMAMAEAAEELGVECKITEADSPGEFAGALESGVPGLIWSSLYYFADRSDIIGIPCDAVWVADELERRGIAYIGSGAKTMRDMIFKHVTHDLLAAAGISVPRHCLCPPGVIPSDFPFPAFVKPDGESRSVGIDDTSVVNNRAELAARLRRIWAELRQNALVEEFLPGREYTVMVAGDGEQREILPGVITVGEEHYGKYHILRSDLRGVGLTKISVPKEHFSEAVRLAAAAADVLGCRDHVRIDMREGSDGKLRIIEVNGIPGMKPLKSWSPQIFALYHPSENSYRELVRLIITSALRRI